MNRLQALWGCAAVLACAAVAELVWPDGEDSPPPRTVVSAAPAALTGRPADQVALWVATLLTRPPFAPDRRPLPAEQPVAGGSQEPPRLAGILISGGRSSALFTSDEGRAVAAQVGDHVGVFAVRAIRVGEVVLDGPDGERVLRPRFAKTTGTPLPPPPAPARPPVVRPQAATATPSLLPLPPATDARPFNLMQTPSGVAIFSNAPPAAGVRK